MPYLPPHLRDGGGSGGSGSESDGGRGSRGPDRFDDRRGGGGGRYDDRRGGDRYDDRRRDDRYDDRRRGDGYDDRRRDDRDRYDDRRRDDRDRDSRSGGGGGSSSRSGVPPAVFANWKPSERVQALSVNQCEEIRRRMDVTVEVPAGTDEAPPPIESFEDMNLDTKIMMDIKFKEFDKPTPIQAQAIPVICSGRDVLGCAETGSGKTAAFSIPMIQHCLQQPEIKRGDGPFAIVMAPTRELAQQIEKEAKIFSRSSKGFKTTIVVGGTNMSEQRMDLKNGVEVCVATPGRLIDHLHQGNTNLARVSLVILDEADRMLDMGFEPQIREVMMNLPKPHQTLLFSATMPVEVEALAADYLNKPVKVKVGAVSVPTSNVAQHLEKLVDSQKVDRLCELLLEEKAEAEKFGGSLPMTVVFVERKARADEIMTLLNAEGVAAAAFHGGRSQQEREAALADFTTGRCAVLVATDVAARGLDVKGVQHVVNLDLPRMFEDYVHRVGRTGRAGMTGRATSFYTDRDSFLVAQIKRALQELENGNAFAFATGKEARAKEREAAKAWREGRAGEHEQAAVGGVDIIVDDKFKHMKLSASSASLTSVGNGSAAPAGNADDAFGSDDDDDGW